MPQLVSLVTQILAKAFRPLPMGMRSLQLSCQCVRVRSTAAAHFGGVLLGMSLLALPALATNRYVATTGNDNGGNNNCAKPSSPCATIQNAINQVFFAGDTIYVAAGTYTENVLIFQDVTIQGSTTGTTTVNGNNAGAVFTICVNPCGSIQSATVVLNNLKITRGSNVNGGGINNFGGTTTVSNSTVSGNTAHGSNGFGGGIGNGGTMTVINSTVSGNTAPGSNGFGGGIGNGGTMTVINSTVSDNSATVEGGGIDNFGTLTVTSSTLSGNSASREGGGIGNRSILTVIDSTLIGNSVVNGVGGGIYNDPGTVTLTNSTLSNNTAPGGAGGGVYNGVGTVTLTNSTLSGNSAGQGGGIENFATLTVTNSTLSGNIAPASEGGDITNGGTATALNTIVANSGGNDCFATSSITSGGHNLDDDGTCFSSGGTDLHANPMLGPLQDNGAPVKTMALLPGSPAIDAGSDVVLSSPYSLTTDQRGFQRRSGAHVDIGAYELQTDGSAPLISLSASLNPAPAGQSVTFAAILAGAPELGTPIGVVTFYDGATVLGTGVLVDGTAVFAASALAPGTHSITAVYPPTSPYGGVTSSVLNEAVDLSGTATALSSTANPSIAGTSVTFIATVSATLGVPTGTITFMDGSSTLGTGTLSGGTVIFPTSSLAIGAHSISAVYRGSSAFSGSTSAILTQTVNAPAPQIVVSTSQSSQTVSAGNSTTYNLTVSANGTLSGPVTFGCIGLPAGATCSFSPNSVNAGSSGTPVTLTVTTTARSSAALSAPLGTRGLYGLGLAWGTPAIVLLAGRRKQRKNVAIVRPAILVLLFVVLICVPGCGGRGNKVTTSTGTPAGTYSLAVTSTSGSTQNASILTLIVQ